MQVYRYPEFSVWADIVKRPASDYSLKEGTVSEVLRAVREKGDSAVREYTLKFDRVAVGDMRVSPIELEDAQGFLPGSLKEAISAAAKNIRIFHESQRSAVKITETMPGVRCWQKTVPVDSVGLYIPGGSAPLFSTVLMLGIPASIAGCREIVLCTPPGPEGKINPAILYAAHLCGITRVYAAGGIQAIGAMAYGTESIPKVDKIFGPGNAWVMLAKQKVSVSDCAIDMPAGPSEVAVLADDTADADFIAADLLSQAEHGPDSQVLLITTEGNLIKRVMHCLQQQLEVLPRMETAMKALENSRAILLSSREDMLRLVNLYAPEHLIISTSNALEMGDQVTNAGSVFLGNYTPESAGDYASGTNHTLPTNGWARSFSGITLDSFCKKITFQEITKEGIKKLGPVIEEMAAAEQLFAHKNAATVRMKEK